MLRQDADIVTRRFFGCERVDVAADRVDLIGDLQRGARRRSFEQHVLDHMRNAAHVIGLISRADTDPNPQRDRLNVVDVLGDNSDAVGKHFAL